MARLGTKIANQWLPIVPDAPSVVANLRETWGNFLNDQRDQAGSGIDSTIIDIGLLLDPPDGSKGFQRPSAASGPQMGKSKLCTIVG